MKYTEKKENGLTKMWNVIKSLAFSLVGMFSPFIQNEHVCVFVRLCAQAHTSMCSRFYVFGPCPCPCPCPCREVK